MIVAGLVLAVVAALLHVAIFAMESIAWTSPRVRAVFGTTREQAESNRELAFNQGFYNLFLAVVTVVGVVLVAVGRTEAGAALVLAGAGSMTAAAVVLVAANRRRGSAALTQGLVPALAVVATTLGLLA